MNKCIQISSRIEIEHLKSMLIESSTQTKEKLLNLVGSNDPVKLLMNMKFGKVGCDPLEKERSLNIIEQLNQTFTYLASLLAVESLLDKHPKAMPFTLNLGTAGGVDIQSSGDGGIVAEVFSATNPGNNQKLTKDVQKVSKIKESAHKYVFYMCPGYAEGRQDSIPEYPDVIIWALPANYCLLPARKMTKVRSTGNERTVTSLLTTRDVDVIASRIAVKQLLIEGYEVADLNNLVPFSSIYRVGSDIVERYAKKGPMRFLKEELKRKDPRILFFHQSGGNTIGRFQTRMRYAEIPKKLSNLTLKILSTKSKYVPMDYLILDSGEYTFVELKANNAQLSRKQLETAKMILDEGYSVLILHVSLAIDKRAEVKRVPLVLKENRDLSVEKILPITRHPLLI